MDSLAQCVASHQQIAWKNPYLSIDFLVNLYLLLNLKRPVLLIYDGHYTHTSTRFIIVAMNKDVQIGLYPNCGQKLSQLV